MRWSGSQLELVAGSSLFLVAGHYRRRSDGELQFDGERPGSAWHAHGYFSRMLNVMDGGKVVRVVVWKRRWLDVENGSTTHSRPLDDPPLISCSTLVVALVLFGWLEGGRGVHSYKGVLSGVERSVSARTAQRYLARCLPEALIIQQHIRRAVMERCEPRPWEQLFPSGLSPPEGLLRRRWRAPDSVEQLWRGLTILFSGAVGLEVHVPVLLAEARREVSADNPSLLI